MANIAVIGAGAWGQALAVRLADNGHKVALCYHRQKPRALHANITHYNDIHYAATGAEGLLFVVPSHALVSCIQELGDTTTPLCWATKGLAPDGGFFSDALHGLGITQGAVLSGPNFADEVQRGKPCATVIAGQHTAFWRRALESACLRVYVSADMKGVQLMGAGKNIIAMACGMSDGLGLGENARAALIARGLAELTRLARALGAADDTLFGVAGVGDLVLTAASSCSRNYRFGRAYVAREGGGAFSELSEGVYALPAIRALAARHKVELPICAALDAVLAAKDPRKAAKAAVTALMLRAGG